MLDATGVAAPLSSFRFSARSSVRSENGGRPTWSQRMRLAHFRSSGTRYTDRCRHAEAVMMTFQSMPAASRVVANHRTPIADMPVLPSPWGPRTATRRRVGIAPRASSW
ncbi:hypothetical protein SM8_032320 [Streptomyces sp. SM8]|nr:hypothetical protein SM8_032320 [Streptomyces sp. SM8]